MLLICIILKDVHNTCSSILLSTYSSVCTLIYLLSTTTLYVFIHLNFLPHYSLRERGTKSEEV